MGRILVIRGGAVGDFILTVPAINLLKQLPGTELEILGYPSIISLAESSGLAERTRSIEHGALSGFFIPNGVLDPDWMEYFESFNLIVSYLYDPDGYFLTNLEKCKPGSILTCSHGVNEPGDHAAVQLARPLEKIALFLEDPSAELNFGNPGTSEKAVHTNNGSPGKTIAIHPGSGGVHKTWSVQNWIAVATEISRLQKDCELVVVTGEAEEDRGITAAIVEGLRDISFEHLDSLPLPELASRLATCDLFFGHDSGVSHLAAACGVSCLLLFGPTDPDIWSPQNKAVRILRAPGGDLRNLKPDQVVAEATRALTEDD